MFEITASTLIMFLALLPYFAIRQLADVLGADQLARLLFVDGKLPDADNRDPGPGSGRLGAAARNRNVANAQSRAGPGAGTGGWMFRS